METIENQTKWVEEKIEKELWLAQRTLESVYACIEMAKGLALNMPDWDIHDPKGILDNIANANPFAKAATTVTGAGGFLGWILSKIPLIDAAITFLMEVFAAGWLAASVLNAARCWWVVNALGASLKAIKAYYEMLNSHLKSLDKTLKELWEKCPCAVPEEYGGHPPNDDGAIT